MTYVEIIEEVANGAKFTINFEKRTCRMNGKVVTLDGISPFDYGTSESERVLRVIEKKYRNYKHSVPSERSESHRRSYFKALSEKELSDEDMMYGEKREVARCKLELYILWKILQGFLRWDESWGAWFWQSPNDKDLVILRSWIEPNGK